MRFFVGAGFGRLIGLGVGVGRAIPVGAGVGVGVRIGRALPLGARVDVEVDVGVDVVPVDKAVSSPAPSGLPQPVHASHPGPALKSPLFPDVMSWNVPDSKAMVWYNVGFR
ncbi:MAG TPA: hypothetical protein VF783_24245, partial [Terriglobales bacterium]